MKQQENNKMTKTKLVSDRRVESALFALFDEEMINKVPENLQRYVVDLAKKVVEQKDSNSDIYVPKEIFLY